HRTRHTFTRTSVKAREVDAPKSRSWKSGFLRKRWSPIERVDTANALKLTNYVGQRVALTGTLMSREMRPRPMQRVAASYNQSRLLDGSNPTTKGSRQASLSPIRAVDSGDCGSPCPGRSLTRNKPSPASQPDEPVSLWARKPSRRIHHIATRERC